MRFGSCRRDDWLEKAPAPAWKKGRLVVLQPNTAAEVTQTEDGLLGGMADVVEQTVHPLVAQGYGDPDRRSTEERVPRN